MVGTGVNPAMNDGARLFPEAAALSHATATHVLCNIYLKAVLWLPVTEVVVCVLPYNGSTCGCDV